jgi:hypothetical protein
VSVVHVWPLGETVTVPHEPLLQVSGLTQPALEVQLVAHCAEVPSHR